MISWFALWLCPFADMSSGVAYFEKHCGSGAAAKAWAAGLQSGNAGLVPAFELDILERILSVIHPRARWSEWDTITAPPVLITGSAGFQSRTEVQTMLRRNPHARHVEVPGAGHDVHLDEPAAGAAQIDQFLTSQA